MHVSTNQKSRGTSMSTKTKLFSASLILAASLMTAGIAQAQTAPPPSSATPQDNRCWGEAASNLAQMSTGAMGMHSKSSKAPQDTFRDGPFGGGEPRNGVGPTTTLVHAAKDTFMPLGQHAVNNSVGFTDLADPVTGDTTALGKQITGLGTGTATNTALPACSTGLQPNIDFVPN
jgi:hypothetical protein